jgi:excisionase family DNA binding protein
MGGQRYGEEEVMAKSYTETRGESAEVIIGADAVRVIENRIVECVTAALKATKFDVGDILTIKEASKLVRLHEVTIRRMISNNEFPAHKIGTFYYIYRPELKKWFLEHGSE